MKEIILKDFRSQTFRSIETTSENPHRLIIANPIAWKNFSAGDIYIHKNDSFYPLAPHDSLSSFDWSEDFGHIVSFTKTKTSSGKGDFIAITSKSRVLAFFETYNSDFDYPAGSPTSDSVGHDIVSFNGKVVAIIGGALLYKKNEDNSGSWASFGGGYNFRYGEVFNRYFYVSDTDSSGSFRRYVQVYDSSLGGSPLVTFDVGQENQIVDIRNINDTYIAVVTKSTKSGDYTIFFWDGISNSFIDAKNIVGSYQGLTKVAGSWYLVSVIGGSTIISELIGFSFIQKEIISTGCLLPSGSTIMKNFVFGIGNYLVLPMEGVTTTGNFKVFNLINLVEKESFSAPFTVTGFYSWGGGNNEIFVFDKNENSYTRVRSYYIFSSSGKDNYYYFSNWIKLKERKNINIRKIIIFYDNKPSVGDEIKIYLNTKNDYNRTDFNRSLIATITSSAQKHRTVIDVNKLCSKFQIEIHGYKSGTSSWSGVIKEIAILYEESNIVI